MVVASRLGTTALFLVAAAFAAGAGVAHAHDIHVMTFVYLAFTLLFAILTVIAGFFDD
jgi:hypothetical protein